MLQYISSTCYSVFLQNCYFSHAFFISCAKICFLKLTSQLSQSFRAKSSSHNLLPSDNSCVLRFSLYSLLSKVQVSSISFNSIKAFYLRCMSQALRVGPSTVHTSSGLQLFSLKDSFFSQFHSTYYFQIRPKLCC